MTRRDAPIDPALDAQISALLDGALDADTAARLRADPVAAARIAEFERGDALVAGIFAAELDDRVPQRLHDLLAPAPAATAAAPAAPAAPARAKPRPVRRAAALALAACLGAAATFGALRWSAPPATPGWIAQIAGYHRVYSAETTRLVEIPAEDRDVIHSWLGGRVGAFEIPDFAAQGLEFRGARLLAAVGKPVAQLVYTNAAGDVVALCITPRPGAPDAPPRRLGVDGFSTLDWRSSGQAFILIAPANGPDLGALGDIVRAARA